MIIGILLFIVFGAACVYLYSYIMYFEKKVSMMESLLVDMRMAVDSLISEEHMHGGAGAPVTAPSSIMSAPLIQTGAVLPGPDHVSEEPEDTFYTSVLEEAHEQAPPVQATEQGVSLEDALQGFTETVTQPLQETTPEIITPEASQAKIGPNYDAMTRAELISLAEQRGLRAKKSMSRSEILGLLRRSEPTQIQTSVAAGSEDAPGTNSVFPAGASLDGDFPVDLGQNGASLAENTVLA
jgi:hypothetical protein